MPHTLSTLFQDQVSEFDRIYTGGQLLLQLFFLLPYQNFACPVLKSKIHYQVEVKCNKSALFVLAEYLSIYCSKFNARKISFLLQQIFFLFQMCYHTLLKHQLNDLTNFLRRQTYDKHKNNTATNGWLLFLGNLFPRFLSYLSSRGWVGWGSRNEIAFSGLFCNSGALPEEQKNWVITSHVQGPGDLST